MFKDRASFTLTITILIFVGLMGRTALLMLGDENRKHANLALMSRTAISLSQLSEQAEYLKNLTDHIDDVPLKDIKAGIYKTIVLVDRSNTELSAQYKAWLDIKTSMNIDRESYLKLRETLSQVQTMQDQEVLRLNRLLSEAKTVSPLETIGNFFLTFFLGVLSSFIASALYPPLVARVKRFIETLS